MIVDHLGYGVTGGAAIAALRIHDGLRKRGVNSRYWYSAKQGAAQRADRKHLADQNRCEQSTPHESPFDSRRHLQWPASRNRGTISRLASGFARTAPDLSVKLRHLKFRPGGFEYFSTGHLRHATDFPAKQLNGDVLVLHWIGKLFDYPSFFQSLPKDRPVVWVLHDMNPFTGGCHFSAGCERFTEQCGNCPQIASPSGRDVTFATLRMKQSLYSRLNLHVVAPSEWLSSQAQRSVPFANATSHRVIPYGLETDKFRPIDRQKARQILKLDPEKKIVLFGAASSSNPRKGFHCLLEAWANLPREGVQGIMFGGGEAPKVPSDQAEILPLGFINDPDQLSLVYSAADLFVLPSLEDNLPQTGLEAMACATPVVAFDTGGIPDYVRHGETGFLAPTGDSQTLGTQICRLLESREEMDRMGEQAREMMLQEYSQPIETARYAEFLASVAAEPVRVA